MLESQPNNNYKGLLEQIPSKLKNEKKNFALWAKASAKALSSLQIWEKEKFWKKLGEDQGFVWYMCLKTENLLLKNICENTCEWKNV